MKTGWVDENGTELVERDGGTYRSRIIIHLSQVTAA